jgi:tRNA-dihydrouridine synthase B
LDKRLTELGLTSPVALAPLAGITDLPFRRLVAGFGAGLVVSEMVASQEVVQAKPEARAKAELDMAGVGTSVQLAGRDAYWMSEAARFVAGQGASRIDINMGCPAKKVTSGYSGSALMRDLDHALTLIEAVVDAVDIPVTLKTRLGWDDALLNAPDLARRAEAAGVRMITIHGRTRCQFYKGHANWEAIGQVVDAVDIPVLANGDIVDTKTAHAALAASGAAGVMVGRGAQGQPWLLAEIMAGLHGVAYDTTRFKRTLSDIASAHYDEMLSFYGAPPGGKVARKHLGWYMDTARTPAALRKEVLTASPQQVRRLLPTALGEHSQLEAA